MSVLWERSLSFRLGNNKWWNDVRWYKLTMQSSQQTTASLCIQRDVSLIHNRGANLTPKSGSPFLPLLPFHSSSPLPSKDASVSECTWTLSALEALRNALYKFKTYLLTYLLTPLLSPALPAPSPPLSCPPFPSIPSIPSPSPPPQCS